MKGKEEEVVETVESKEHADYNGKQSDKSPFEILDEVEAGGGVSFADVADDTEREYETEVSKAEGGDEETGLKSDKKKAEAEEDEDDEAIKKTAENKEKDDDSEKEKSEEEKKAEKEKEDAKKEEAEKVSEQPEWLVNKLKEINPELDVEDPEQIQSAIDEMASYKEQVDQAKKDLEAERESNLSFYNLLEGSEDLREVARFMHVHGADLNTALSALEIDPAVDMDELKKTDPDAYLEAVKKREEREAKAKEAQDNEKQRQEKLEKNADKSAEYVSEFKKEFEVDDEQFESLVAESINPEIDNLANGLVTKNFLSIVFKGLNYEQALQSEYEKGLTEGKNMKIDEQKGKKKGDKLPALDTSAPKKAEKEEGDIFSEALKPVRRISEIQ